MIGRRSSISESDEAQANGPKGFDDFELRLGDVMRGERATMGKSLLDVQRELRIKAAYIAAIENCDPAAFDTPGFIAGYVRSYARYLGMDPDLAFATFCAESGFEVAHGMSAEASGARKAPREERLKPLPGRDMFSAPATPFVPSAESVFSRVEPGAIGSMLVLLGLIGGIGYGAWAVLQEVQRVQVAPVDRAPSAIAEVDPLEGVGLADADVTPQRAGVTSTTPDALYRLYRPEALEAPVMTPRDGPIAALDPAAGGALANVSRGGPAPLPSTSLPVSAVAQSAALLAAPEPITVATEDGAPATETLRVTAEDAPGVMLVAVGEVWLRVRAADGTTLKEATLKPCETYAVPDTDAAPSLRVGSAGAIYFAVNGQIYGLSGANGEVKGQIALGSEQLIQDFALVDPQSEAAKDRQAVQVAEATLGGGVAAQTIKDIAACQF